MAGGKPKFQVNFETYCEHHFAALVPGVEVPLPQVYHPLFLPQFGKVNPALFSYIVQAQRQWGLWLDPVYSAKLFQTALTVEQSFYAGGRTLLRHSGGQSSLMGFTAELMAQCGGKKIR
jgi:1-aminocyclopropane-1-carboxylate deaminase/D-cysteine desulfhydrase-like pyridoxal-dependent ACC family enzyme